MVVLRQRLICFEQRLQAANAPIKFIKINHAPDGSFPNGIPNPMIIANRKVTADTLLAEKRT